MNETNNLECYVTLGWKDLPSCLLAPLGSLKGNEVPISPISYSITLHYIRQERRTREEHSIIGPLLCYSDRHRRKIVFNYFLIFS
jgi:hypothetical protein